MNRITLGTPEERQRLRDLADEGYTAYGLKERGTIFLSDHYLEGIVACIVAAATVAKCGGFEEAVATVRSNPLGDNDIRLYAEILGIDVDLLMEVSHLHEEGYTWVEIDEALAPEPTPVRGAYCFDPSDEHAPWGTPGEFETVDLKKDPAFATSRA